MPRILSKKEVTKAKNLNLKFYIDCTHPVEDKVLLLNDFEDFLKKRVKIEGKTGHLGNDVTITATDKKIEVSS